MTEHTKFIFVTGGVSSSLGKGITSASLGRLFKSRGLRITMQKLDPYINVDPGTMNPFEHGEVFVLDDGAETDLDLGHYERFTDESLHRGSNLTTGAVYQTVIAKERRGEFLGRTVQVIPHITDEIKARIQGIAEQTNADLVVVEIGGTVGDIESLPFLEAIRQLPERGREGELRVRPRLAAAAHRPHRRAEDQAHAALGPRAAGHRYPARRHRVPVRPAAVAAASRRRSRCCATWTSSAVVSAVDAESIYEVPLVLHDEGLDTYLAHHLRLPNGAARPLRVAHAGGPDREGHRAGEHRGGREVRGPAGRLPVGDRGPEARRASTTARGSTSGGWPRTRSPAVTSRTSSRDADGILVPGGFGVRGVEGKVDAIRFARERGVPFLGICLGLQCAVIEFARDVCGLEARTPASSIRPASIR